MNPGDKQKREWQKAYFLFQYILMFLEKHNSNTQEIFVSYACTEKDSYRHVTTKEYRKLFPFFSNIYFIFKNIYFTDVIESRACTYTHVKLYVNIRILVTTFVLFYAAGSIPHILE
jgi:hypothetical protein